MASQIVSILFDLGPARDEATTKFSLNFLTFLKQCLLFPNKTIAISCLAQISVIFVDYLNMIRVFIEQSEANNNYPQVGLILMFFSFKFLLKILIRKNGPLSNWFFVVCFNSQKPNLRKSPSCFLATRALILWIFFITRKILKIITSNQLLPCWLVLLLKGKHFD